MAFPSGLGDRTDDIRFRNPQSPRDDAPFPAFTSPLRGMGNQMSHSGTPTTSSEARASLHRRFTTNNVPTLPTMSPLSPIGQARRQAAEPSELTSAQYHKVQLYEKKKLEYEFLKEQRRRFEAEMELLDLQAKREESEMHRLATDLSNLRTGGHQSEPTTPPEFHESGFSSSAYRPNRYSTTSITSPTANMGSNRPSRSGSQITSPYQSGNSSHMPSKSVPGTRRNSDEEEDPFDYDLSTMNPRTTSLNRNSMPVTKLDKRERGHNDPMADYLSGNLGAVDTTTFLFDDDKPLKKGHAVHHSVDVVKGGYLQMETNDEKFPILVRQNGSGNGQMQLSASSAALDLALSQSPGPEAQHSHAQSHAQSQTQSNGWGGAFARPGHRRFNTLGGESDIDIEHVDFNFSPPLETPSRKAQRHSMEVKFSSPYGDGNKRPSLQTSSPNGATNGMPKQGASYSTNDIPTMKKINGFPAGSGSNTNATPTPNGDQAFHKHNTSLGRVPPGTSSNRHSRDLSAADNQGDESMFRQASAGSHSSLHASAPPFGPAISTPTPTGVTMSPTESAASTTPSTVQPYGASSNYYGFGMNMIGAGMNGPVQAWGNHMQMYPNAWGHYPSAFMQTYGPRFNPPSSDSQSRVMQQRRAQNMEDSARFGDRNLEEMQGEIYNMCKDQHGCRFLQKKLEDRDAHHVEIIFNETKDHVVELMTDPFGNYLCQKLLEFTDDQQRTVLINNASDQMVRIAFNQHGTRALQKMIEFISTREQVETIIRAFRGQVVNLIQDLNGNHVIQKCLNHLKSEDAQFIFDAVGDHCVEVGTHRHGCCVLQRCIDHASGNQKVKLVDSITRNSKALVRDPFGNYVVQYILDLQQIRFTQPVCAVLLGDIVALSKQKFSSNVVEKCIRVGDTQCKRVIIEELLRPTVLDQLLRDQYANYVIQTSLEYSPDPATRTRLVEAIRPLLSSIRGTPYGRRIANKITDRSSGDGFPSLPSSGNASGTITPNDMSTGTVPSTAAFGTMGSNGFTNNVISPQPHRVSNPTLPTQLQSSLNQNFANFATGPNPQTSSNPHGRQGQHNQSNGISGSNGMHPNGMGGGSLPPGGFF